MTIVVSDMIGSGIFFTTGFVIFSIAWGPGVLGAWVVGGMLAMLGALSYGEMAAAYPKAGGEYNYLREAYGPLFGFLSGWTSLFIGFSAPIAIGALAFVKYLGFFVPGLGEKNILFTLPGITVTPGLILALCVILILACFHFLGRGTDKRFQVVLTILKIAAIVGLILVAAFSGGGKVANIAAAAPDYKFSMLLFAAGIVPITFCYSGWNAAAYIAGEIKNPGRNLPLAMLGGTLIVTLIYLAINLVYLYALPVTELKGVGRVAEKTVTSLLGQAGGAAISAVIALSVVGAINAMMFIAPRVFYAMARDGLFFEFAAQVDPNTSVPRKSIMALTAVALVMVLFGTLRDLLQAAGFVLVVFSFLAVAAVFVLRVKQPNIERPYKAWGYPITPAIFCAFSIYLMYASFVFRIKSTIAGIIIVLLGVPVYFWFRNRK